MLQGSRAALHLRRSQGQCSETRTPGLEDFGHLRDGSVLDLPVHGQIGDATMQNLPRAGEIL